MPPDLGCLWWQGRNPAGAKTLLRPMSHLGQVTGSPVWLLESSACLCLLARISSCFLCQLPEWNEADNGGEWPFPSGEESQQIISCDRCQRRAGSLMQTQLLFNSCCAPVPAIPSTVRFPYHHKIPLPLHGSSNSLWGQLCAVFRGYFCYCQKREKSSALGRLFWQHQGWQRAVRLGELRLGPAPIVPAQSLV